MKINIRNKKGGYASLEVIAMSLIGFTLVLALLSITLNKKILIDSEIKTYEKRLDEDDEKIEFLGEVLSLVNKMNCDNEVNLSILANKDIDKEILNKGILKNLSLLGINNNKFNLYFNEEESILVLEETLENSTNIYYYDYEIRDEDVYFKER